MGGCLLPNDEVSLRISVTPELYEIPRLQKVHAPDKLVSQPVLTSATVNSSGWFQSATVKICQQK